MSVTKPLPHDAAPLHVSGTARYVDDIPTPKGSLHLAFGTQPDCQRQDHGDGPVGSKGCRRRRDGHDRRRSAFANDVSPSIHDEPLLSDGTVHYIGQPVFLVVATSHLAARKAARLGKIDYAEETRS